MLRHCSHSLSLKEGDQHPCGFYSDCPLSVACEALGCLSYSPVYQIHFDKNQFLFRNEIDFGCIYVVVSGIVVIYAQLDAGEQMVYGLGGKGYTIGETEYFTKKKFAYLVKTLTPTVFCRIPVAELSGIIALKPHLMSQFIQASYKCMDMFGKQMWVMNAQRVYDRLKRLLFVLALLNQGEEAENHINISHEELGLLINTNRVTITRILHVLEKEGEVRLGYNDIQVLTPLFNFPERSTPYELMNIETTTLGITWMKERLPVAR